MDHPILIRGINRRSAVIFEIWGVPDGRTVEADRVGAGHVSCARVGHVDAMRIGRPLERALSGG
jgi:hypothetical protein